MSNNKPVYYEDDADGVDYRYWVDGNGKKVLISNMDNQYINNVIDMLERAVKFDEDANEEIRKRYVEILNKQLLSR